MDCTECKMKESEAYCKSHQVAICLSCGLKIHKLCNGVLDASDIQKEIKGFLNNKMAELEKDGEVSLTVKKAEDMVSVVKQKLAETRVQVEDATLKVTAGVEKLFEDVQKKAKEYLRQIEGEIEVAKCMEKGRIETLSKVKSVFSDEKKTWPFPELLKTYQSWLDTKFAVTLDNKLRELDSVISEGLCTIKSLDKFLELEAVFVKALVPPKTSSSLTQTNHCVACCANAYTSELYLWDLTKRKGKKILLELDSKPFIIPFKSECVNAEGVFYIVGGVYTLEKCEGICVEYSGFTRRLRKRPQLNIPRKDHAAVFSHNKIFCVGGATETHAIGNCEKLVVSDGDKWEIMQPLNIPRAGLALIEFTDKLYAIGGVNSEKCLDCIEVLDLCKEKPWTLVKIEADKEWTGRHSIGVHAIEYQSKTNVMIFGGRDKDDFDSCFLFDPANNSLKSHAVWKLPKSAEFGQRKMVTGVYDEEACIIGHNDLYRFIPKEEKWEIIPFETWHPL